MRTLLLIIATLILACVAPPPVPAHAMSRHALHVTCSACGGNGVCWVCHGGGKRSDGANCSICGGSGRCAYCNGRGEH